MFSSISSIDSRYKRQVGELQTSFSYKAWIKYRCKVEVEYLIFIIDTLGNNNEIEINEQDYQKLLKLKYDFNNNFTTEDLNIILEYEKKTHHDIKSIEYWLRYKFNELDLNGSILCEFIHFGLTSQDVNSMAFSLQLKDTINSIIKPNIRELFNTLNLQIENWNEIIILGLTHGQPALPTSLGKEFRVYMERLTYIYEKIENFECITKFGGAVGNLNAHKFSYPHINWLDEMTEFCSKLGLKRWKYTTQITNYEDIAHFSHLLCEFNTILIDLCQDIWLYISRKYFILEKENKSQVGSSTMPQKVNPINFENAEGNLKLSTSGLEFIANKLCVSRLQRDLTDSTILRNYGVYVAHHILSIKNIVKGLNKLTPNLEIIKSDLERHPEIMGEAIQIILRKNGIKDGYNIVRECSQNMNFNSITDYKNSIINYLKKNIDNINTDIITMIENLQLEDYLGYY